MKEIIECIRKYMRAEYKMSVDTIAKRCKGFTEVIADELVKEGILKRFISFRDPSEGAELSQIEESLLTNYINSKPVLLNLNTGIKFKLDELLKVPVYQILNALSLYQGLEPTNLKERKEVTLFGCDLVKFSEGYTDIQISQYEDLKRILSICLNHMEIPPKKCFAISSGDGFYLIFDNIDVLLIFKFIDLLVQTIKTENKNLPMRFSVNSGHVYLVTNKQNYDNAIGHAININSRILSFGEESHILITEDFYKMRIERTSIQNNFHDTGAYGVDKHGHKYRIYNYFHNDIGNSKKPEKLISA
ncbi:hypothetical protein [Leptospira kanakyensis]|uniref:hypothetical protein n=1 Tax=Leptospira kanakyensis TaxID=2484968 RepID=UPI00223E4E43|nr:hypothetical protein [Leptospira kanakyensis]MCW7471542.1 hypothetical protein [Leptospira kanakyensis]